MTTGQSLSFSNSDASHLKLENVVVMGEKLGHLRSGSCVIELGFQFTDQASQSTAFSDDRVHEFLERVS